MKKFTANYCHSNPNFVITNLPDIQILNSHTNIIRIVQNLLTRGAPTIASAYIRRELGLDRNYLDTLEHTVFLTDENLNWSQTIKGDVSRDDYPADQFYDELPEILKSVGFLRNLMIAECKISDILPEVNNAFHDQQVDFYLPLLRTIIEIDGSGHLDSAQRQLDSQRDRLFERNAITVIRLSTNDIQTKSYEPFKIELRKVYIKYKEKIDFYKSAMKLSDRQIEKQVLLTSIARIRVINSRVIRSWSYFI